MQTKRTTQSPHRRFLSSEDDDPLSGVANLFDVTLVFVVALLIALMARSPVLELLGTEDNVTVIRNSGTPKMEIIRRDGQKLTRYRISEESLGGEGERLGTAYRLKSGEVIYVPEVER